MPDRNAETALKLARLAAERGGTAYYTGGFVRDRLLRRETKDIDVEVHGLSPRELEAILGSLGERVSVGESFGVYRLRGLDLDVAMPRREECRGSGHRDFDISVDPFIGTKKAAERRDFTVNALMENILTGEVIDHFGGVSDLRSGVLRHVSGRSFPEDPLRVLRAAQFAARFGFTLAPETVALCRRMELGALARERVMGEMAKALLKAPGPSVFFEVLREMGQLEPWFPELKMTVGIPQSPVHHAEGDVWRHTMLVLDEAAKLRDRVESPLALMLAALCHDFGKAVCTTNENGVIRSLDHERLGLPLIESFMRRLTSEKALIDRVLSLCELHMRPNMLAASGSSVAATNRLFDKCPDPEALVCLALADGRGKIPQTDYGGFLFKRLEVYREYMSRPYVMGRDLIEAGLTPSPRFAAYLAFAHKLRLAGVEKGAALRQTLAYARQNGEAR